MKHLILAAGLVLVASSLTAVEMEAPAVPAAAEQAPTGQQLAPDASMDLFTPAPENRSSYITWSGSTCTAWLYCPGEPYWKCQSSTGNCQHTGCSITCNGHTRRCQGPPRYPACTDF